MRTPNTIEQELNQIRLRIYEETKNMTPEEYAERMRKVQERASKKYGIKFVARAQDAK